MRKRLPGNFPDRRFLYGNFENGDLIFLIPAFSWHELSAEDQTD